MNKLAYKECPNPECPNYGWEQLTDAKTCNECGRKLEVTKNVEANA